MKRRALILIGLPLGLVLGAAAFGWGIVGERRAAGPGPARIAAAAASRTLDEACFSTSTYERLKARVFETALDIGGANADQLDLLAGSTVVRMQDPILKARDEDLGVTVCNGRFVIEIPPGAAKAFGGRRQLAADIEYAAQIAADGSGIVYQLRGAEPITYRLAALGVGAARLPIEPKPAAPALLAAITPSALEGAKAAPEPIRLREESGEMVDRPARHDLKSAAKDEAGVARETAGAPKSEAIGNKKPIPPVPSRKEKSEDGSAGNKLAATPSKPAKSTAVKLAGAKDAKAPPTAKTRLKRTTKTPSKAETRTVAKPARIVRRPSPVLAQTGKRDDVPAKKVGAKPVPAAAIAKLAARARQLSSRDMPCGAGRPLAERLMCANPGLASKEKRMMGHYYSALDSADPRTRRILQDTAADFQSYRNNCRTEACLSGAFEERSAEIRDIMASMR